MLKNSNLSFEILSNIVKNNDFRPLRVIIRYMRFIKDEFYFNLLFSQKNIILSIY